jgi:leucyl/phenylalanyl-tRNA--protein transferase
MYGGTGCGTLFSRAKQLIPWIHEKNLVFPNVEDALKEPNGLLCAGGDLSVERLLNAYRKGIFPWFSENEPILWWSPNPRLVLEPKKFKARRSLRQSIRKQGFEIRFNTAFKEIMSLCSSTRENREGTWISPTMRAAYDQLNHAGFGFSAETYKNDVLVGGLYGVKIGRMLFGESMVSLCADASKAALAEICNDPDRHNIELIDCQVPTTHLESLGACLISRQEFINRLQNLAP